MEEGNNNNSVDMKEHQMKSARAMTEMTTMNTDLKNNRAMSQTFTNLPGGRVYKLDRVIEKIKDSQRKQIKVL